MPGDHLPLLVNSHSAPPHSVAQLNTGSSGRLHSRVEALDEGQVGLPPRCHAGW